MFRIFSVVLVVALWLAAPVRPYAALDAEGLRRDLIEGMSVWFAAFGAAQPSYDQVVTVAERGGIRARIVALSMPFGELDARLHLGDVSFLVRDGGAGRYRISDLRTEPVATFRDGQGQAVGEAAYSIDHFSGLWSPALLNFVDLDAAVSGVKVVFTDGAVGLRVERLSLESRMRESSAGLSDLDTRAQASGVRALLPQIGTLRIESIYAESKTNGQDLAAYRAMIEEFRALGASNSAPNPQEQAATLERLAGLDIWPRSFIERLRLSGLSTRGPDERASFRLREVEFDAAGHDLRADAARGSLGVRFSDMSFPSGRPGVASALMPFVPTQGGFIMSLERVPLDIVWRTMLSGMAAAAARGEGPMAAREFDPALQVELMAALTGAGTALRLERLDLDAPDARLIANGVLEASTGSPAGATGRLDAEVFGLDKMIAATVGVAGQGGDGGAEAGQAAAFLFLLKSMARRETAESGRPVDRFTVEMTVDGQLLINGDPFSALAPTEQ